MGEFRTMVICLLIDEQEKEVDGRRVLPKLRKQSIKACHLEKVLKLGVHVLIVA